MGRNGNGLHGNGREWEYEKPFPVISSIRPREGRLLAGVFCFVRKISKIGATRCHILRLKCTKFDFRWGAGGAYSTPQTPVFKGPTSKGRRGRGGEEGMGREEGGKGRGEEERGREGNRTTQNLVATPMSWLGH